MHYKQYHGRYRTGSFLQFHDREKGPVIGDGMLVGVKAGDTESRKLAMGIPKIIPLREGSNLPIDLQFDDDVLINL